MINVSFQIARLLDIRGRRAQALHACVVRRLRGEPTDPAARGHSLGHGLSLGGIAVTALATAIGHWGFLPCAEARALLDGVRLVEVAGVQDLVSLEEISFAHGGFWVLRVGDEARDLNIPVLLESLVGGGPDGLASTRVPSGQGGVEGGCRIRIHI